MKRRINSLNLLLILAVFLLAGCQGSQTSQEPSAPVESVAPAQEEGVSPAEESDPAAPLQAPPGDFDLLAPGSGLESLSSYHQAFEMSFEGTLDGQPHSSSTKVDYTYVRDPFKELSLLETTDQDGQPLQVMSGKFGKTYLLRTGVDGQCQSVLDESLEENMKPVDPAALLPPVYGAEEVGPETINGVEAMHYKFDERSLRQYGQGKASGSVWVAAQGGWVVRYELEIDAPDGVLGESLQGKQTWTYDLTDAGSLETIDLPEGCRHVLVVIDSTPGAQNVIRMPGYLSYTTQESRDEIKAFYEDTLVGRTWEQLEVYEGEGEEEVLVYRFNGGTYLWTASVMLSPIDGGTAVAVHMIEGVPAPEPTAAP